MLRRMLPYVDHGIVLGSTKSKEEPKKPFASGESISKTVMKGITSDQNGDF
jgi:hypothetical protein